MCIFLLFVILWSNFTSKFLKSCRTPPSGFLTSSSNMTHLKPSFFILSLFKQPLDLGERSSHAGPQASIGPILILPSRASPHRARSPGSLGHPCLEPTSPCLDSIYLSIQDPRISCPGSLRSASRACAGIFSGLVIQPGKGKMFSGSVDGIWHEGWDIHTVLTRTPCPKCGVNAGQTENGVVWQVGAKDWGLILTCLHVLA